MLILETFDVVVDEGGNWLLHERADSLPVAAKMPKDGYYFDMVGDESLDMDFQPPPLEEMEKQYTELLPSEKIEFVVRRAEELRPTGKALFLDMWLDFGPPSVGSTPDSLCLMSFDPDYVERLFEIKTEADLARLGTIVPHLKDFIDIFGVDGIDYGTQRAELFNPELFERFHLPPLHRNQPVRAREHIVENLEAFLRIDP